MPRGPRIDYPGLLQHVYFRGLNRQEIFRDDADRYDLLKRFEKVLSESQAQLFAWVFMDNHVHMLIKPGKDVKLGNLMRRILTGYALKFNRKYGRVGYLFQGRYKSTVCDEEGYLQQLVQYIHLNPFRAGMVKTMPELADYPWSGHRVLLGIEGFSAQNKWEIWGRFGGRKGYREFIAAGMQDGCKKDCRSGTALVRNLGGVGRAAVKLKKTSGAYYDQRVLGDEAFIAKLWTQLEKNGVQEKRLSFSRLTKRVCAYYQVDPDKVIGWPRERGVSCVKALLVSLAVKMLRIPGIEVGRKMSLSASRISQLRYLGENLIKKDATVENLASLPI